MSIYSFAGKISHHDKVIKKVNGEHMLSLNIYSKLKKLVIMITNQEKVL